MEKTLKQRRKGFIAMLLIFLMVFESLPLEVLAVCVLGMRRLMEFKYKVENFYADVEGKTLVTVQALLVVFVVISMASAVASLIGRDAFFDSKLLALPSFLFSALLVTCSLRV